MTEEQLQRRITDLCDWLGLKWHHETDSRRTRSGWLDLVIAGPHHVLFAELKSEKGRVTKEQQEWIDRLSGAGADVVVWRPSDWAHVERVLRRMAGAHGKVVAGSGH